MLNDSNQTQKTTYCIEDHLYEMSIEGIPRETEEISGFLGLTVGIGINHKWS